MKVTFEEYWQGNLFFRLRGVMGLSDQQIATLKTILHDTWKCSEEETLNQLTLPQVEVWLKEAPREAVIPLMGTILDHHNKR